MTSLTTLVPVSFTVTGQDVTIDGAPAKNGVAYQTTLTTLDDATSISIAAVDAKGAPITYKIHTIPAVRPMYTVTTNNAPTPGHILLAPNQLLTKINPGPAYLYILDETGRMLFYKESLTAVFDFQKQTLKNGQTRYTYISTDAPIDWTTWPVENSTVHVLDDQFHELQAVTLLADGSQSAAGADAHDFKLVADDDWIVESYVNQTVSNVPNVASANVVGSIVQEVQSGSVALDWQSTSLPVLYTDSTEGNNYTAQAFADYNHLNSLDLDPANGNVVVSLRHDDAVMELDRATGSVVWTLGGLSDDFGLAPADKTSHQHFVRFLEPNHLLMFDNGNASMLTKIREYQIDPQAKTAQVLAALSVDNHFSMAMGSVQKFGTRYFIGWGFRQATESDVTEIDSATQEKSFELSFANNYVSYRALKYAP